MSFNLPFGLNIASNSPTDTRQQVQSLAARDALVTGGLAWEGMQVYTLDTRETWMLEGQTNADWVLTSDLNLTVNAINGLFSEDAGVNNLNIGFGGAITQHSGLFLDGFILQFVDDGFITGKYINWSINSDTETWNIETLNAHSTFDDNTLITNYTNPADDLDFTGTQHTFTGHLITSTDQTDYVQQAISHQNVQWSLYDNFSGGGNLMQLDLNYNEGLKYSQSMIFTDPNQLITKDYVDTKTIDGGLIT